MMGLVQDLLVRTLTEPRAAAVKLIGMNLPGEARWMAFVITVILTVLVTQSVLLISPLPPGSPWAAMMRDPVSSALTQGVFVLGAAWAMAAVAGWFGGRARFADTLLAVSWIEFVLLVVEVVQILVLFALPFLSLPLAILTVVLFFWLLTQFTASLNGFVSLPKVFAGVLATMVVGGFLAIFVLGLFGLVTPPVPA
jgi:hypothetical protein